MPLSRTSALWPETSPPAGALSTLVMPLARATGMSSLSGWSAIQLCACGFMSPTSVVSTVAETACTSVRPSVVKPSTSPG